MTNEVTVEFAVERARDVPRIGQRKTVRVNGRPTLLYCRTLHVKMVRDWDDDCRTRLRFEGEVVYGPTERTWRGDTNH